MLPRALCLIVILSLLAPAFAKDKFSQPRPIQLDRDGEKWAQKTLHNLSLEEKVGQLFMIWVRAEFLNVNSPEYLQLRDSINKYHVGSFAMTVRAEGPFLYRAPKVRFYTGTNPMRRPYSSIVCSRIPNYLY